MYVGSPMLVGLISDPHANLYGLRAALDSLRHVDLVLCAGDLTGYYTRPNEVIELLAERRALFITGNHDAYLAQGAPTRANDVLRRSIDFTRERLTEENARLLAAVPPEMRLNLDGLSIAMFHGSPWDPLEQYIYPDYGDWDAFAEVDADVIVLGHTHRPVLRHIGGRVVVNPGSCGQPRDYDPRAAFAVLDTRPREVRLERVTYDIDAVEAEVRDAGLDEWLCAILRRTR